MKNLALFLVSVMLFGIGAAAVSAQSTSTDVDAQIRERASRLNQLNQEIQSAQSTLNQVQKQKSSLQTELKKLDTSIRSLDLNIQADGVVSQKLTLEIGSLADQLQAISQSIRSKEKTVADLFRAMQRADEQNMFVTILSGRSLADALLEVQSLHSLRNEFSGEVEKLSRLSEDYHHKLGAVTVKKGEVELHQENLENRKFIVEDQKSTKQAVLQETRSQEAVYQEKLAKLKAEQDALEDEIARMESQLNKNFNTNVLPPKSTGVLAWPLQDIRYTQHFGARSSLYRGKPHNGSDFAAPLGSPVFASADGTVMAVDNNDQSAFRKYQYGRYVLVKHSNNLATLYAHLSRQTVGAGQAVRRGELIGYSGSTGYSTGPHLHFGLYWAPSISLKAIPPAKGLVPVGVVLNPEDYL